MDYYSFQPGDDNSKKGDDLELGLKGLCEYYSLDLTLLKKDDIVKIKKYLQFFYDMCEN